MVDGEIRVEILLRLVDRDVFDRVGILIERVLADVVLFLDDVVVCLFLVETLTFRDPVEDGLRTTGVPTDRRVLTDPRERLEDVRDLEAVVRLGVLRVELRTEIFGLELRLDVIDLDRLVEVLRVGSLEELLRVDVLGATDRVGLRVTALRDDELGGVALRLLLLELLLFRELLDARAGSTANTKNKRIRVKNRKTCVLEC